MSLGLKIMLIVLVVLIIALILLYIFGKRSEKSRQAHKETDGSSRHSR